MNAKTTTNFYGMYMRMRLTFTVQKLIYRSSSKIQAMGALHLGYYFPLRAYKKGPFFLIYYVFFAVQSESEIHFWRSNL